MEQIHLVQIGAQSAQAGGRRFVAQHKSRAAHQLGQKTRLAAGACAHVQHSASLRRIQGQRRQHGRTVLNIDIAEKGRQRRTERARLGHKPAAAGRKRLRLKVIALGAQQIFGLRQELRSADKTERTGIFWGHGA